jgi:hypothetical protein
MFSVLAFFKRNQESIFAVIRRGVVLIGFVYGTFVLGVTYLFLYGIEGSESRPFSSLWLEMIPVFIFAGVVFQLLQGKANSTGKSGE